MSTPPLARVEDARTMADYGPAPAFVDVKRHFFVLGPERRLVGLTFELPGYVPVSKKVLVTNWATTASEGPQHVTQVHAAMQACQVPALKK
jgi:hypothetical protein